MRKFREYVAAVRERDPRTCWPFGSVCEFKDLNTQDVAPKTLPLSNLKITEDTNASKCKWQTKFCVELDALIVFMSPCWYAVFLSFFYSTQSSKFQG